MQLMCKFDDAGPFRFRLQVVILRLQVVIQYGMIVQDRSCTGKITKQKCMGAYDSSSSRVMFMLQVLVAVRWHECMGHL
jgi:hypothetical protein